MEWEEGILLQKGLTMRVCSLFAGIGGFDLAAEWMGWETKVQVEIDDWCRKVLAKNFPHAERYGDIKTFDGTPYHGAIDLVCGGFPCQPFSMAGKRLGTQDERHLWPQMLRVIREIQPRWVVGENVSGIVNWSDGLVLDQVLSDLEAEGYETIPPLILPACGQNAIHQRDRTWFVAYSGQIRRNENGTSSKQDNRYQQAKEWQTTIGGKDRQSVELGYIHTTYTKPTPDPSSIWSGWTSESPVCGVDDGVPSGLDEDRRLKRLGAMGNAIVPQVVYQIFQAIQHIENQQPT